ncbi:MAG: hypothetical protein QXQ77_02440 [Candidatus Aenigmatarchaeota archaeon]
MDEEIRKFLEREDLVFSLLEDWLKEEKEGELKDEIKRGKI